MALTKITGEGIQGISNSADANAITISSSEIVTLSASSQRAQTFVLQADESGDGSAQTLTNWAEQGGDYTRVGAANFSESAGIFSSIQSEDAQDAFDTRIEISTDSGSNFTGRAVAYTTGGNAGGNFMAVSNSVIFTVSNTTTFRLRMRLGEVNTVATSNEIFGDSNQAETSITFIKLGVI